MTRTLISFARINDKWSKPSIVAGYRWRSKAATPSWTLSTLRKYRALFAPSGATSASWYLPAGGSPFGSFALRLASFKAMLSSSVKATQPPGPYSSLSEIFSRPNFLGTVLHCQTAIAPAATVLLQVAIINSYFWISDIWITTTESESWEL